MLGKYGGPEKGRVIGGRHPIGAGRSKSGPGKSKSIPGNEANQFTKISFWPHSIFLFDPDQVHLARKLRTSQVFELLTRTKPWFYFLRI